jgi:hypothetical protein
MGGFAGGLAVQNLPVLNTYSGKVFWVDENGGGGSRGTFERPILSIEEAMSSCVANRGDIIMVKPGHVENISSAAALTCDVAGVSIVGLGSGAKQAKIEFDTADTADISVTAANVSFINLWLFNNFANVDGAFVVAAGGDDFCIRNCRWTDGSNALDIEEGISLAAGANGFKFLNNDVRFYTGGDTESLVKTVGECVHAHIEGNIIIMAATAAIFDMDATALTGSPVFKDNVMVNLDTTTGLCVAIANTTVGVFVNERYASNKSNTVPASDLSVSYCIECYGSELDNVSSLLFPATATNWGA